MKRFCKKVLLILVAFVTLSTCLPFISMNFSFVNTYAAEVWGWPVPSSSKINQYYKGSSGHSGVDIGGSGNNVEVVATLSGTVVDSYPTLCNHWSAGADHDCSNLPYGSGTYGNFIVLEHNVNGVNYYSYYAHMVYGSIRFKKGDTVVQGTVLGYMGSSGSSTGQHLHFEIRKGSRSLNNCQNPLDYVTPGNVIIPDQKPYLTVTGYDPLPSGKLTQGNSYPVKGTISSYPNINHVWGGVYYRNGDRTDEYCDVNPDSTFYDLSTHFDANIIFNNLPVGYYTYKIEATTTDGQYAEIHSDFQIGEPPPPISYYEVRLDASGGEVSPGSITVHTDGTYNGLPTPGRYGYDFAGWFDDSGRQVSDGTGIYTNAEHTLYARWSPKSVTVYLNANGGMISPDTMQISFDNNYNNLPNPVRDGYNFVGWFTTADGGTQVDFNSVCSTVDEHTLYAHWSKDKFMITFNAMGGTVETANKIVVYDNKYGVLPTPQKKGYEFKGWYLEENCVNQITSASIVNITGNQSIYAKWELKKYHITFDANGGEIDISSKQVTAEKKYGVLPEPSKLNSRFLGWYTVDETKIVSSDTVELSADTTLYAKWQLIGDINSDDTINIADAVRLQNYLLCRVKLNEAEYYAGDINEDGSTDVFDMVCMRRMLIERNDVL